MGHHGRQRPDVIEVAIVLFDGTLLSSLGAFLDLAAAVKRYVHLQYSPVDSILERNFDVLGVTLLGATPDGITSSSGLPLPVERTLDRSRHYDLIILPGFEIRESAERFSIATHNLIEWLRQQRTEGAIIAASGSAMLVLGEAGLTKGVRIAVAPGLSAVFAERFPGSKIDSDHSITEDAGIFCSIGLGSDHALMLLLIERLVTPNLADWIARKIGIDRPNQPAYVRHSLQQVADPLISQAQSWLQQRFPQPVTIGELAANMTVSRRTLSRRFSNATGMTPLAYLQFLRIEAAKHMLERQAFKVNRIAGLVGYSDVRFFKRLFETKTGMSPHAYRAAVTRVHARARA